MLRAWAALKGNRMSNTGTRDKVKQNKRHRNSREPILEWYPEHGFGLFPLDGKKPTETGWRRANGAPSTLSDLMPKGVNVGANIPNGVIILDVDVRGEKAGLAAFESLLSEHLPGTQTDELVHSTRTVRTGSGGLHLYFEIPQGYVPRGKHVAGYDDIDILYNGMLVVVPPSIHPDTNGPYEVLSHQPMAQLPRPLCDLLLMPLVDPTKAPETNKDLDSAHPLWGVLEPDELRTLLNGLDPCGLADYLGQWFPLLCAAHHATGGLQEAAEVFTKWSQLDPHYEPESERSVGHKWPTVHEDRARGSALATVRTILAHLHNEDPQVAEKGERRQAALRLAQDVRDRLATEELERIATDKTVGEISTWINNLPPKWDSEDPGSMAKLIDSISHLDELHWPLLSGRLAEAASVKVTGKQIEMQVRRNAHEREKENKPKPLTQSGLVELAAIKAIRELCKDKRNLLRPPNGNYYVYSKGKWATIDEGSVKAACYRQLKLITSVKDVKLKPLPYYRDQAEKTISSIVSTRSQEVHSRSELPSCINLNNGTLWINRDGTSEFKDHNRDDYLTAKLPFDYDPQAKCPAFDTMIEQVFDHVEKEFSKDVKAGLIRHFWELVGYMIQPNKDIPKILVWIGDGQNGKSKIAEFIADLVGPEAWLKEDIGSFFAKNQPHNLASAHGKLVIIDDDLGTGVTLNDGALKKVSQKTYIQVNPKNQPHYSTVLHLTPIIITNNTVRLNDSKDGITRRLDVIEWNTNLRHLQNNPLVDIAQNETQGILNRAIEGLLRLRERGDFDPPACSLKYKADFLARSNTVIGFWEELDKLRCEGLSTSTHDLFMRYQNELKLYGEKHHVSFPDFMSTLRNCGALLDKDFIYDWVVG